MRKFVSVVAVLVMLFALAMPAFAAAEPEQYSVSVGSDATIQVPAETGEGYLDVWGIPEEQLTEKQAASLDAAAVENAGKDAKVGDLFQIEAWDKDGNYDPSIGATVTIVYTGDGVVAGVLYWNATSGVWDYAAATNNGDGTYSVTLKHLCPAALVITPKPASSAPAKGGSTGTKSPQTGFDASAYMMVTATLVLFAGFCFVKARKVTE